MSDRYEFKTIDELREMIDSDKEIMFDTETIGLYGKIRLAQFYQRGFKCPVLIEYPSPYELMLLLQDLKVVIHNAHYDVTCIQAGLGKLTWMPKEFHCTFLLSRLHFYKHEGFSLDNVIQYVLGMNPYGKTKKDMQASDWAAVILSEDQKEYAADDVLYLHDVWDVVKEKLEDINYKLDLIATRYCLDFQNNGLPFERDKLEAKYAENMKRLEEINLPINCNSYQQVRPYINSNLSDDKGLAILIHQGNEKAAAVRECRKLTKNNSFLTKFINTGGDTDTIYGKFKCSPRSGRTASDDQNLQQLPRSTKGIFGVPEGGDEVIIFSDFPAIQLRGACVIAADRTMERLFREGEDLHNYVARFIFGENFTPEQRQICKTANFGLLFGAGIAQFQSILLTDAGLWLSEEEAKSLKAKWLKLWKQVAEWQQRGIKAWRNGVAWETPLGRRYTSRMMTDQLAMQIQGFEAEVAKLAMHYMMPKMKELHPDLKLRNFMHDSYLWTGPNDPAIYEKACGILATAMQEGWSEMSQSVPIKDLPMPIKVRVGYNWGDIEKDHFMYEHKQ